MSRIGAARRSISKSFIRRAALLAALLLAALSFAGIAHAQEPVRLGLVLEHPANPFWTAVKQGAEEAAAQADRPVELIVFMTESIREQVDTLEDLIQMRVDAIGVTPWEPAPVVPAIERANQLGIPIFTIDQDAAGGERVAYIATDNVEGGRAAARWLAERLNGSGRIAILEGQPGSVTNRNRLQGFHEVLKEYPGIQVVASLPADWQRDKGLNVASDILIANPRLDAIMALNDEMALGALAALKVARRESVILVGYNGAAEAIEEVYRGGLDADVVQFPELMGRYFVEWSLRYLDGQRPDTFHLATPVAVVDGPLVRKIVEAVNP